jgi:hypothetical protein
LAILLAYLAIGLFVLGQKLSLFVFYITVWFVLLPGIFPNFTITRSHVITLLCVAIFLLFSVLVSYSLQDKEAGFALARIALQAQLAWSVFSEVNGPNLWPESFTCYFGCGQFVDGIDFITFKYLPIDTYKFYSKGGTTLSGFMPALSVMTMGILISFFCHFAISFLLGMIQRKMIEATSDGNMVLSFLLFKLLISLTLIWFAAMNTAIPGFFAVLLLACLYRWCMPASKARSGKRTYSSI